MGAPIAMAAGGALGAYAGYEQQKKIQKSQKNQKNTLLNLQGQMMDNAEAGFGAQEGYIKQANKASEQGYGDAIADADRQEFTGTQEVNRLFDQANGASTADAASRGLLGSTVSANMRSGNARRASLAYTDAQLAASRLRTSARIGLSTTRAAGLNNLGNFEAYRANSRNRILSGMWDYVANQNITAQSPQANNLAQLPQLFGGYKPTPTV